MNNQNWMLLGGAALGASAMYLLGPRGRGRRRAKGREEVPDARKLQKRVRTELARVVSHPRAIDVYVAADGRVWLTGPVLMEEADKAISTIQSVRGVRGVDDRLERYTGSDRVAARQGVRNRTGRPRAGRSWSPSTAALVCLGGTALAVSLRYTRTEPFGYHLSHSVFGGG